MTDQTPLRKIAADRHDSPTADRGDLKILNTALKELRYAFKTFAPYAHIPKVTIFGSARTSEHHPQYAEARKFAELIQRHGWMVITGAGDGIMRAGHHGATRQKSFGVAISLPFEQAINAIIAADSKLVNFKYFFTRKLIFVKEAEAIVLFPGGFGTQAEGEGDRGRGTNEARGCRASVVVADDHASYRSGIAGGRSRVRSAASMAMPTDSRTVTPRIGAASPGPKLTHPAMLVVQSMPHGRSRGRRTFVPSGSTLRKLGGRPDRGDCRVRGWPNVWFLRAVER